MSTTPVLLLFLWLFAGPIRAADPPNIIVVLADDIGGHCLQGHRINARMEGLGREVPPQAEIFGAQGLASWPSPSYAGSPSDTRTDSQE